MAVINGITCQEIVRQLSETVSFDGGPKAVKGYLCPWANRFTVAQGLLGYVNRTTSGGTFGSFTLLTPQTYPEISNAYAHSISFEGVGPPTQGSTQLQFTSAIVWVNYQWAPFGLNSSDSSFFNNQIDPNTPMIYCRQTIKASTQWITIPGNSLKFASGNPISQDQALPVGLIDLQLQFMRVPYLPAQAIMAASVNPLNSITFLGQQAGSVLFNGADSENTRDSAGNMTQNLNMSFTYRTVNWDQAWDPVGQAFSQIRNSGGTAILTRSDLNQLIVPGYLV